MGLMEGLGPSDIVTKCVNNLWPILWTNWKVRERLEGANASQIQATLPPSSPELMCCAMCIQVWPIIQIVMFLYVPLKYRVPLAGVCNVLWTIWLSWQNAK